MCYMISLSVSRGASVSSAPQQPPTPADFAGWSDAPVLLRPRALDYVHLDPEALDRGRLRANTFT
jgi:hypothetical protein